MDNKNYKKVNYKISFLFNRQEIVILYIAGNDKKYILIIRLVSSYYIILVYSMPKQKTD